jgi:hypothetical protein
MNGSFGYRYYFKTPGAYYNKEKSQLNNPMARYEDRVFRAMKSMRPGAIQALARALIKDKKTKR